MQLFRKIGLVISLTSSLIILITCAITPSCKKNPPEGLVLHDTIHVVKYDTVKVTCDTTNYTYSGAVSYIFNANCATVGCHTTAGAAFSGGYDFSTYAGSDSAVLRGRVLGSINQAQGYSAMPKSGGKLSSCEIKVIQKWIDAGAPNN